MDWAKVLRTIWMVIFTPTFFLVKVLYWPVSILFSAILVLLSPIFYTVQYCLRPLFYVYSIIPRLKVGRMLPQTSNPKLLTRLQPLYLYVSLSLKRPLRRHCPILLARLLMMPLWRPSSGQPHS